MARLAQLKQDKFWPFSMLPRPKSNQRRENKIKQNVHTQTTLMHLALNPSLTNVPYILERSVDG